MREFELPGPWAGLRSSPPRFEVDPAAVFAAVPELGQLHGAAHDPIHHAEGDVAVHTLRVLEALSGIEAYRALPSGERMVVALACLLHDIAKPLTMTELEGGRIGHPGHARKGARMVRRLLWGWGIPFAVREAVCGLVRLHEVPYFLMEKEDPERMAIRTSMIARCDLLSVVARADVLGRICEDQQRLLDNIALFSAQCEELGCLRAPFAFPSEHTRVVFFQDGYRSPTVEAWDDTRCEVVVLSGLPGAGKDTWLKGRCNGAPVISLDALREELGVEPSDKQGQVVAAAQERAKAYLRRGEGFCWNATNVSRSLRQRVVELARRYGARVRIVYAEAPADRLFAQNRSRPDAVPEAVMERLFRRWEVPDLTEAHAVEYAVDR